MAIAKVTSARLVEHDFTFISKEDILCETRTRKVAVSSYRAIQSRNDIIFFEFSKATLI